MSEIEIFQQAPCACGASRFMKIGVGKWVSPEYKPLWRYNSLSQLLSSTNPEIASPTTGQFCTVSYTYDNIGHLYQKTGPLPNQSSCSTTVTSTFSYEADSRLTKKTYSDGTPTVQFAYDGGTLAGCVTIPPQQADNYPKGRRMAMCDGSGATSWTHDPMGRVKIDKRTIGAAIGKTFDDAYNLDGSLAVVQTLKGNVTTYTPGGAGRPLSAVDNGAGINFVTNATCAPFGGLKGMNLGSKPITVSNSYNKRLQPVILSANTSAATIMSLSYDFHLNTANNGNVYQIVNNRDNNRTQNFAYDPLNRIATGYSSGSNWGETFTVDTWGNLTNRAQVSGKTNYEPLSAAALNQNRLTGFGYDAAGNMTSNSGAIPA